MSTQRLVVRSYAPLRRALLLGGGCAVVLMGLYVAFEWGRTNAGFDARSARADQGELQDRLRELESENRRQRLQLAAGDTQRVGQAREREELARSIGDLQAEVASLTRNLAFYRGVVGESASADIVRVQQFRITRGATATLDQAVRLPAGFAAARVNVELVPARKGVNPVRETFLWTVENG